MEFRVCCGCCCCCCCFALWFFCLCFWFCFSKFYTMLEITKVSFRTYFSSFEYFDNTFQIIDYRISFPHSYIVRWVTSRTSTLGLCSELLSESHFVSLTLPWHCPWVPWFKVVDVIMGVKLSNNSSLLLFLTLFKIKLSFFTHLLIPFFHAL